MIGTALILAGHGSHVSADTAGVVWAYVDRLRRWGVADEVTASFWKEAPAFSQALETVEADEVVIVPVFAARGYFTGEVIPAEFGLTGGLTVRDGRRIHLTDPLGERPELRAIVERRLRETVAKYGLPPADTAAVIIGHGTRRNRQSRDTAQAQARRIVELNWLGEAVAVYLDDEPDIPSAYKTTQAANIIALPYFVAQGSHVRLDIPRALGISTEESVNRVNGRSVYYCEPVGTDDANCHLILDLARGSGLPFEKRAGNGAWRSFPRAGRRALLRALDSEGALQFGQVMVRRRRVWHRANEAEGKVTSSAAALRALVREAPFRPLATSADLPSGWQVKLDSPEDAHAVIETVYPGLLADWAADSVGALKTESLEVIRRRQRGMFKDIQRLPQKVIARALDKICGNCIRQPTWARENGAAGSGLPCRSACNYWLSSARRMGEASL